MLPPAALGILPLPFGSEGHSSAHETHFSHNTYFHHQRGATNFRFAGTRLPFQAWPLNLYRSVLVVLSFAPFEVGFASEPITYISLSARYRLAIAEKRRCGSVSSNNTSKQFSEALRTSFQLSINKRL